jgi:MFS family permease
LLKRANIHRESHPHAGKALLCAITAFFWFAQYIYIPFLTPYLLALSLTATVVGLIVGAYGVTQLILRIPLGITVDIVRNHKLFIVIGTFLAGTSSLGMIISPSPVLLFTANALSGAASSTWISFTILYASYYDKSEGTKAIGRLMVFTNAGRFAAFILGGILFERIGIRGLFITSFASGIIGSILALFIRHEREAAPVNISIGGLVRVVKERSLLFFSMMCALTYLVLFGTVYSFTTSTAKNMGATGMELALFAVLFSAAAMLGSYFVGTKIGSELGEKYVLLLGFLLLGLYCVGIAFSHSVLPFFPLHVIVGLASGVLISSLMANAIRYVDKDRKSTAMGFYQSVYCFGITLGPVLMGALVDHASTRAAFIIMALIALACAGAIFAVYKSNLLIPAKTTRSGIPDS